MLTKNQVPFTALGLNNGAMGTIISICYEENKSPPDIPQCVVVQFPDYKGPAWLNCHPKWIPVPIDEDRCEQNCCSRRGFPLITGYAIPIAKSQGMTIGENKPATNCRVKLKPQTTMEQLNLGTTYTALSRVDSESNWALVEPIPEYRIMYINDHPKMKGRVEEEHRLREISENTVKKYIHYADDINCYINLLKCLDESCTDSIVDSECSNSSDECRCIICRKH